MKTFNKVICLLLLLNAKCVFALESTGLKAETTIEKFIDLLQGKIAYFVTAIALALAAFAISYSGIAKNWTTVMNFLVGGAIVFGSLAIFQFFFGVDPNSLMLP